jgi:hypothetical protein
MKEALAFYKAFTEPDAKERIKIYENQSDYMDIYYKADDIFPNKKAFIRNKGMVIKISNPANSIIHHYAGVVVIRGKETCKLIQKCETPKHDRLEWQRIKKLDVRAKAKNTLEQINKKVSNFISKQVKDFTKDDRDVAGVAKYLPALLPNVDDELMLSNLKNGSIICTKSSISTDIDTKVVEKQGAKSEPQKTAGKTELSAADFPSRTISTDAKAGECRITIKPQQNQERVFLKLSTVTENGKDKNDLEILSFIDNQSGKIIGEKTKEVGPISLFAGTLASFTAKVNVKGSLKFCLGIAKEAK